MKLLVGFGWRCLNVCRRVICRCPGMRCGLLFQELDERFNIAIRQPQVGHTYFFIFLKQRNRGGIMFRNELVGLLDEAFEPCAITRTGDAQRSGPIFSPCPMVWQAAQCPAKMYCPGSSFTGLASA